MQIVEFSALAQQEAETSKTGLDPSNDAGPSGTGGAAAGAMPEMPPEAQPGYHEPPSQRPPMWHPQVPPQESNLNAEQLVPPQVPGRASDGKRYPDPLQDGVDTTVNDPEPRADVVRETLEPVADKISADAALNRPVAMATSAALASARADDAERPTRHDPHWGPMDVPDEPPEVILVEEQHGQPEPPSQKPPMWFIQVPAQTCNFEAERMLPPQVPPRHTDHLRYPDNLQAGFEQKYPDPYDPTSRVEVAVERNIKIAKDKLPPDAEIVSHVLNVRKILDEP